ncbi:MAG: hypothetical protein ABI443_04015 [Chthoniobacterales bacterium]
MKTYFLALGIPGIPEGPLLIAFAVAYFAVALLALNWVYNDAKKRTNCAGVITLLVLCAGFIGLVIWWLGRPEVRTPTTDKKRLVTAESCERCVYTIAENKARCPNCGHSRMG